MIINFDHKCVGCGARYDAAQECDWCGLRTVEAPFATRRWTPPMPTPEHRGATNAAGAFVAWAGVVLACVVLFAVVLATSSAHATTLGLHLVSVHSRPGYCDANPGLYLRTDSGWVVGAYRNSRCEASVYAAYALEHRFTPQWSAALALGAVSGYGPHLKPLAVPSLAVDLDDHNAIRLHIAPKVRPMRATFMHLSYERKF